MGYHFFKELIDLFFQDQRFFLAQNLDILHEFRGDTQCYSGFVKHLIIFAKQSQRHIERSKCFVYLKVMSLLWNIECLREVANIILLICHISSFLRYLFLWRHLNDQVYSDSLEITLEIEQCISAYVWLFLMRLMFWSYAMLVPKIEHILKISCFSVSWL